jgi:hypothetical protein
VSIAANTIRQAAALLPKLNLRLARKEVNDIILAQLQRKPELSS